MKIMCTFEYQNKQKHRIMKMETLTFEFGKYTEITKLAHFISEEHKNYIRLFICWDVNDFWLIRVQKDINKDYEREDGVFLLERNNIPKEKTEKLTINKVKKIILEDDFSNWDCEDYSSIKDLISDIDGGFGINNLDN